MNENAGQKGWTLSLKVLALAPMLAWAVPGTAQAGVQSEANASTPLSPLGVDAPMQVERPGFAFPIIRFADPTGTQQQRKGLVVGEEVAPGVLLGLGMFETAPKTRSLVGDVPAPGAPKRSRRAALGLSFKF